MAQENNSGSLKSLLYIIIIILLVGGIAYLGMRSGKQEANQEQETVMSTQTFDNGMKIEVLKEGTGDAIKSGEVATVNYTGTLTDGTKFDSNVDPAFNHVTPFEFVVDGGMVIRGWDEGVLGMKVGEVRRLTLPPELAYGPRAIGKIPANATLVFEVELLGISQN